MANVKDSALTEITDPLGSDTFRIVDDPGGTPATRRYYGGSLNLLPDSWAVNYTISVTVATNDITVALKTKSGGNPSSSDPVTAWFNGNRRRGTASLSVTKTDGTNWFGSGASELATLTVPYFVYLIWNTTPATDILDIGFSRIPYGRVASDFSTTSTDQNYLAHANASNPASTDDCINIGRFEATLSATASFNWSVPTFTSSNLIQHPIYWSNWHTWTPTLGGFSANPTNTIYEYMVDRRDVILRSRQLTNGTSNATTFTMTAPFNAKTLSNAVWQASTPGVDNGSSLTTPALASLSSGSASISLFKDYSTAVWTNANGKRAGYFELRYPIA